MSEESLAVCVKIMNTDIVSNMLTTVFLLCLRKVLDDCLLKTLLPVANNDSISLPHILKIRTNSS